MWVIFISPLLPPIGKSWTRLHCIIYFNFITRILCWFAIDFTSKDLKMIFGAKISDFVATVRENFLSGHDHRESIFAGRIYSWCPSLILYVTHHESNPNKNYNRIICDYIITYWTETPGVTAIIVFAEFNINHRVAVVCTYLYGNNRIDYDYEIIKGKFKILYTYEI